MNKEKSVIKENNTYSVNRLNITSSCAIAVPESCRGKDKYSVSICFDGYITFTNEVFNCSAIVDSIRSGIESDVESYMETNYPVNTIKDIYTKTETGIIKCEIELDSPEPYRKTWVNCTIAGCVFFVLSLITLLQC